MNVMVSDGAYSDPHPNQDFIYDMQHISDVPVQNFVAIEHYASIANTLSGVPRAFRRSLLDQYEYIYSEYQRDSQVKESQARFNANRFFLDIRQYIADKHFLNHSDSSLRNKARRYALYTAQLIQADNYLAGCQFTLSCGIDIPCKNYPDLSQQWQTAQQQRSLAEIAGDVDHSIDSHIQQLWQQWQPIKARLVDEQWWIRQLIKQHDRQFEQAAIRFGQVRKQKQAYVSDKTLLKILSRQKRSMEIMSHLMAVSDQGDELEMLDIIKTSPANPAIRRAELMNRLHGFEQYANTRDHIAEFYTLTAPSKYHPNSTKYNHWTPRQTQQQYFSPLWARVRAKFKDKGLSVYGFRIAEPHGDACPHWHILLFMSPQDRQSVRQILQDYALREEGTETGAAKNRFDYESIDKSKGSAIAYIAKYIAKNVDGFGMEWDMTDDGTNLAINEAAQRVRAWASVWGIRQFQQIGGSSISVWRELRRLDNTQADKTVETARQAADTGDWRTYLEVQGGTDIPIRKQLIQLYQQARYDENTGELYTNQYGEIVDAIKGIQANNCIITTRLKHWIIQEKQPEDPMEQEMDIPPALAVDLPWSSVNNCRNATIHPPELTKKSSTKLLKMAKTPIIHSKNPAKHDQKVS